jgi:hypothetical protein
MASVTPVTAENVRDWTGISTLITGEASIAALDAVLAAHIGTAEAEVALAVGESAYDGSSWTARQVTLLQRAVAYGAAYYFLQEPYLRKVVGSHEPLLSQDAEAIAAVKAEIAAMANSLMTRLQSGQSGSSYRVPSFEASTFEVTDSDRTALDRLVLLDERDDIVGADVDNG